MTWTHIKLETAGAEQIMSAISISTRLKLATHTVGSRLIKDQAQCSDLGRVVGFLVAALYMEVGKPYASNLYNNHKYEWGVPWSNRTQ